MQLLRGTAFLVLVALLFTAIQGQPVQQVMALQPISETIIVVDPGHGGVDPGCMGHGVKEKDVVLKIAHKLVTQIEACGGTAIMTRTEDVELCSKTPQITWKTRWRKDLETRVQIAERNSADVLVSIHANSIGSAAWRGAQVFYQKGESDSEQLAESIQESLNQVLGNTTRSTVASDYYLLRNASMAGVIVEVGFLSNPQEARNLASPRYQEKAAWAILQGLLRYLGDRKID